MVCAVLAVAVTVTSAAVQVWIDRVEENDRLLVPLRGVFEAAGATVDWKGATNTVEITGQGTTIVMIVNNMWATVNGNGVQLDVPPRLVGGRVHIPLRFAGEALGRRVEYQGSQVLLSGGTGADIVLLIKGESAGYVGPVTPPVVTPPVAAGLAITSPREGEHVPPRAEVYGTAPGGSMIVVNTEVRAQDDNHILKTVPGLRHSVPADGNWHVAVACPDLPANIAEPLYYVIKAYYETPTYRSPEVSVKVFR